MAVRQPTFLHACVVTTGLFLIILLGSQWLHNTLQMVIFAALIWVAVHAASLGHGMSSIRDMMGQGITKALPAFYIFLMIGMVIAALMKSGTVGALIYFGLEWLDPNWFLPIGFVLCAMMSLATGTSWGTVSTLGVVFIGMAAIMSLPLPWVAGMVISGATFGDKMSPISDTTNLAAMSSEVGLYDHIVSMMYTTVPAFVIALLVFTSVGLGFEVSSSQIVAIDEMRTALAAHFELTPWLTLLPVVVLFGLSILRVAPEISMFAAVVVAGCVSVFLQGVPANEYVAALWQNQSPETAIESLNRLLGRGGVLNMAWTLLLAFFAIALGGLLLASGFVKVLMSGLIKGIKKPMSLILTCLVTSMGSLMALSEAYVTLILNGQIFKKAFNDMGISRRVLSRTLEDGNTMIVGLIPWSVAGAFYAATLDVPVLDYAPYALLNWMSPLVGVVLATLGWGLFKESMK